MSQYNRENPIVEPHSGVELVGDFNALLSAALSTHYGATRPEGASAGLVWARQGDILEICVFDGTDDVVIWPQQDIDASKVTTGTLDAARLPVVVSSAEYPESDVDDLRKTQYTTGYPQHIFPEIFSLEINMFRVGDVATISGSIYLNFTKTIPFNSGVACYFKILDLSLHNNWFTNIDSSYTGLTPAVFYAGFSSNSVSNDATTVTVSAVAELSGDILHLSTPQINSQMSIDCNFGLFTFSITVKVSD